MCVQERRARFALAVVLTAFVLYGVFTAIPATRPGATAAFAVLALLAGENLVGRRSTGTIIDERDQQIGMVALSAAFGVIWILLILGLMIPFYVLGPNGVLRVRTTALSDVVFAAMGIVYIVRALVMIVLYRKQANG